MPPHNIDGLLREIYNAIKQQMRRPGDLSKRFVCEHDLREIWGNFQLQTIFPLRSWDAQTINLIRNKYLKVLSILIYVGTNSLDLRAYFRAHFINHPNQRSDQNLPLSLSELSFLQGAHSGLFYEQQYAFIPVVIEEHESSHVQMVESNRRLPFIEDSNEIGWGGYGRITEVEIAPRQLYNQAKQLENPRVLKVARKTYRNERSREEFESEKKNLDYLKESFGGGRHRIRLHICALVHGENNFMILLPLAELGDLGIFLRGGYAPLDNNTRDQRQVYNFTNTFGNLTDSVLHPALFKEMREIAAALVWLHNELQILGSSDRYCAHMDLKPENILLTPAPGLAVGKWWISDFGISVFNRDTNNQDSHIYSIRDFGRRITSRANQNEPDRAHGTYQPPEIDEENIDAQKCDIWSFGGVLFDVLAFAIGGTTEVEFVRNGRFDGSDDYFYQTMTSINDSNIRIKHAVSSWLDGIRHHPSYWWTDSCINILVETLVISPTLRPSARVLLNYLNRLNNLINTRWENLPPESPISGRRSSSTEDQHQRPHPLTIRGTPNTTKPPISVAHTHAYNSQVVPNPHLANHHNRQIYQSSDHPLRNTDLKLPRESKIISLAVSANGNQVAFLSKNLVYFYPRIDSQAQTSIPLSRDISWQKISLGGEHLAVYGIKPSGQKAVETLNFWGRRESDDIPNCGDGPVSNVIISSEGVVAYIYRRKIVLSYPRASDTDTLGEVPNDHVINQAAFSADGNWLCAWVIGGSADLCCYWELRDCRATFYGSGYYEKVGTSSTEFMLLPYRTQPACVIRHRHGATFVVQAFRETQSQPLARREIGTADCLTACIGNENYLICVQSFPSLPQRKYRLSAYALDILPAGTRYIVQDSVKIGVIQSTIHPTAKMVCLPDASQSIIICTAKGKYLRYPG